MIKANMSIFKEMLPNVSWNYLTKENNADFAYQNFYGNYQFYSFNVCFPIGNSNKKYSKDFNEPWYRVELSKLLRKTNEICRKYFSNPTPLPHTIYELKRN